MLTAVELTVQAMVVIVQTVPIGTNMGLVRLLWVMVNGSFLRSRGGVIPALALNGFSIPEISRSWAALRYGVWAIDELLENWQLYVASQNRWRDRRYENYRVLSVDITGFWRPKLTGWLGKHYHNLARKALPAVVLGVMVTSGEVGRQRIPLLSRLVRSLSETSKPDFRHRLLCEAARQAATDQVIVVDAEFAISQLQMAHVDRYVVRLASNATARRHRLPAYKGIGRHPEFGETVRPLARTHNQKRIEATSPDQTTEFDHEGRSIQVSFWHDLVTVDTKVAADARTFSIYVYHDPAYHKPLVLATSLTHIRPETAYLIYRDRWPVEQPPLAAKQMVGLHRQFVFAPPSCFRLPELALLAGAILTYVAAVGQPIPTGFWDRAPKATPGRLRRHLGQVDFPDFTAVAPELREKKSVTAHLPKGIVAHRRQKRAA
jgi:hypothetical protein